MLTQKNWKKKKDDNWKTKEQISDNKEGSKRKHSIANSKCINNVTAKREMEG